MEQLPNLSSSINQMAYEQHFDYENNMSFDSHQDKFKSHIHLAIKHLIAHLIMTVLVFMFFLVIAIVFN